ncbi:MAG: cyclic nucleotide-binding domain-containing protein [Candidatus Aminicenantes bacterium]|jgi:CRP-like cAMP-binding protein
MLTTVEKVLLLQDVDIFEHTSTEDLSHIAAIAEEIEYQSKDIIFKEDEISDSMYVVIQGKVRLTREDKEIMVAGQMQAFGTWALFDDEPRVATATALENTQLLRIDKEEFIDLLADHVAITQSILKTMAKRLRKLLTRIYR